MKIDDKLYDEIFDETDKTETSKLKSSRHITKVEMNTNTISSCVFDWVNSIIIAIVAVVLLLTFCFRLIDVDGKSMEPTLINTDKVIVTNLFYTPKCGDIVVISHGVNYDKPLVKRIIATENQKLRIDFENNKVYVDDVLLDEPYIQGKTIKGTAQIPEVVPEGKVFVMGDNRSDSMDSRHKTVGLIDVESIIGKAQFVVVPHSREGKDGPISLDFSQFGYLY